MQELYAVFTIEKKLGAQLYHMGSILSLLLHLKAVTKDAKKTHSDFCPMLQLYGIFNHKDHLDPG